MALSHAKLKDISRNGFDDLSSTVVEVSESMQNQAFATEKVATAISKSVGNIAASNYAISKSILNASNNILFGINRIADEMERQSKLNEYYMLQKEIENLENELLEMQLIKPAYEEMKLSKIQEIELNDRQIEFLVYLYSDSGLEKLKEVSLSNMISPYEVFKSTIEKKPYTIITCIAKTDSSFYNIGGSGPFYNLSISLCYKIEELGIVIPKRWLAGDGRSINILNKRFLPEPYIERSIYEFMRYNFEGIFYGICGKSAKNYEKGLTETEIHQIDNLLSKVGTFKYHIPRENIIKFFDDIYERLNTKIVNEIKVLEFKAFIDSLNQNIALNNLRNLHQELHNKVREYKMKQFF